MLHIAVVGIQRYFVFGSSLILGFLFNYLFPVSFINLEYAMLHHLIGAPLLLLCGGAIFSLKKICSAQDNRQRLVSPPPR